MAESIHLMKVAFQRAVDEGDMLEAGDVAIRLLKANAEKTFSPDASVRVQQTAGKTHVIVFEKFVEHGPDHNRVQTLRHHLGDDVLGFVPEGRYWLK